MKNRIFSFFSLARRGSVPLTRAGSRSYSEGRSNWQQFNDDFPMWPVGTGLCALVAVGLSVKNARLKYDKEKRECEMAKKSCIITARSYSVSLDEIEGLLDGAGAKEQRITTERSYSGSPDELEGLLGKIEKQEQQINATLQARYGAGVTLSNVASKINAGLTSDNVGLTSDEVNKIVREVMKDRRERDARFRKKHDLSPPKKNSDSRTDSSMTSDEVNKIVREMMKDRREHDARLREKYDLPPLKKNSDSRIDSSMTSDEVNEIVREMMEDMREHDARLREKYDLPPPSM